MFSVVDFCECARRPDTDLCAKLAREGVRGLRGGPDGLALDRRLALVEHAVDVRLVTSEDLGLL